MAHAKVQPHGAAVFIAAAASVVFLVSGITSVLSGQLGGTPPPALVVDDSDKTGFSTEGSFWYRTSAPTAHKKNLRVTSLMNMYFANQKAPSALWNASLQPGTYDVQMTWQAKSFLTDSATVTVQSGGTPLLAAITVNQKKAPAGEKTEQVTWQSLGSITVDAQTQVTVRLAGPAKSTSYRPQINGLQMTADAVRFVRKVEPSSELTVMPLNFIGSDIVVKNQKNVNLLRFEAGASKEFDKVLLTRVAFAAAKGSLLNGQNYSLWMDTDKDGDVDTILQDGVGAKNGLVAFDLGQALTVESSYFEVHADIAPSTVDTTLALRFADSTDFLAALDLKTGKPLVGIERNRSCTGTCSIHFSNEGWEPTEYKIIAQGNLYVTKDTMPLRSRQLLGGTLGDAVLLMRLRAENEDIDVTDLQLTSYAGTATSVDRFELYTVGATAPFAIATVSACGSDRVPAADFDGDPAQTFCANMDDRQLVVPDGNTVYVLVRPRMKTDGAGAVSGESIALFINDTAVSDTVTGEGAVRARGAVSNADLSANNGDGNATGEVFIGRDAPGPNEQIRGNLNHVVLSKLASITSMNFDPDNSPVPTGVNAIGEFKFTAAAHMNDLNGRNRATLDAIIFNVNASNVEFNAQSFKFYNKMDASMKRSCAVLNQQGTQIGGEGAGVSGSLYIVCDNLKEDAVQTDIASGESAMFVLEGEVTRPTMTKGISTLQVSIQSFNDIAKNDAFGWNQSHLKWLDEDTTQTVFRWSESDNAVVKSTIYKSEGHFDYFCNGHASPTPCSSSSSSVRSSSSVSSVPGSCTSTAQCQNGMRCSTEWMECRSCEPGEVCADVCTGRCMYVDRSSSSSPFSQASSVPQGQADLIVVLRGPTEMQRSGTFNPNVMIQNTGPNASGVRLTMDIPRGVTVQMSDADAAYCSMTPEAVTCQLPSMASGSFHTISSLRYTVGNEMPCAPFFVRARVEGSAQDPFRENNSALMAVLTLCEEEKPMLRYEVSPVQLEVKKGEPAKFVFTAKNDGRGEGKNVVFSMENREGLVFDGNPSHPSCSTNEKGYVQCTIGTLAPGQTLEPRAVVLKTENVTCGTDGRAKIGFYSAIASGNGEAMKQVWHEVVVLCEKPKVTVDIKINGQDGSVSVAKGSRFTLSWRSEHALRCNTASSAPGWSPNMELGTAPDSESMEAVESASYSIECVASADGSVVAKDTVTLTVTQSTKQCNDGIDNDQDFLIDSADPGCLGTEDNDEKNVVTNNAACTEFRYDGRIVAGKQFVMFVTVQNTGTKAWRSPKHYIFDNDWTQVIRWAKSSWPMPTEQVNPGQSVTFSVYGTAPTTSGTYRMNLRMVESTVEKFGPTCWKDIQVEPDSQ